MMIVICILQPRDLRNEKGSQLLRLHFRLLCHVSDLIGIWRLIDSSSHEWLRKFCSISTIVTEVILSQVEVSDQEVESFCRKDVTVEESAVNATEEWLSVESRNTFWAALASLFMISGWQWQLEQRLTRLNNCTVFLCKNTWSYDVIGAAGVPSQERLSSRQTQDNIQENKKDSLWTSFWAINGSSSIWASSFHYDLDETKIVTDNECCFSTWFW